MQHQPHFTGGTHMKRYGLLVLGFVTLLAGCDLFTAKPAPPAKQSANSTPAPGIPGYTGLLPPGDVGDMAAPVSGAPADAAQAPGTQRDVAGVGSGIQGRSLDDPNLVGTIVPPARE